MKPTKVTTSAQETQETKQSNEEKKQEPEFNKEELLAIFDELLFSGEYVEDIVIKGKLKVSFKSRSVEDVTKISKEIDSGQYNLMITMSDNRALLNLAYSLVSYNGKTLPEEAEDRKKFINKLPSAVVALLSDHLTKFDTKINEALKEGDENF